MQKEYEYCLRCGRKLKNPEARQKGYGMVCEKKMKVNRKQPIFEQYAQKKSAKSD